MTTLTTPAPTALVSQSEILSLIVPVYNEAENFPALLAEIEQHIPPPFVLHVVYDFDEDTTVPVARKLAEDRPWLRLLKNRLGRGVVAAIRTGFQEVGSGPALVIMADLSDDLRIVPDDCWTSTAGGTASSVPSRYMRGGRQVGGPRLKRLLSRAAGLSLRLLARFPTHDATNNFRLYDAALVNELGIESTRWVRTGPRADGQGVPPRGEDRGGADDVAGPDRRRVPFPADEMVAEIPFLVPLRPDASPQGDCEGHDDADARSSRPHEPLEKHSSTGSTATVSRGRSWPDVPPSGGCSAGPGLPATSPRGPAFWKSPRAIANSSTTSPPARRSRWT